MEYAAEYFIFASSDVSRFCRGIVLQTTGVYFNLLVNTCQWGRGRVSSSSEFEFENGGLVRVGVRVRGGERVRVRGGERVRVGGGERVRVGVRVRGGERNVFLHFLYSAYRQLQDIPQNSPRRCFSLWS